MDKQTDLIAFDPQALPFSQMVLDAVRAVPGLAALPQLSRLHEHASQAMVPAIEAAIYDVFMSAPFIAAYDALCGAIIASQFGGRARYQRIPSVRVQLPGSSSVNFHTDEWYGHGNRVHNFWLPLVDVGSSASLAVLEEAESDIAKAEFMQRQLSIGQLNELCAQHSRLLEMRYGQIYQFNARRLHGTFINRENYSRVSFDFRMLEQGDDPGKKDASFFVSPGWSRAAAPAAAGAAPAGGALIYVSPHFNCDFALSQKYQQLLCLRYAKEQKLDVVAVETELSGVAHYPNLRDAIGGTRSGNFSHLVLFSRRLLPADPALADSLLAQLKGAGVTVHCVAEDAVLPA